MVTTSTADVLARPFAALHAARRELLSLGVEHGLSLVDFTLVRSRVATAITEAQFLPR